MKRTVVMFDVDGVLADFVLGFSTIGARLFGSNAISTSAQERWDAIGGMTPEQIKVCWTEVKQNPQFWYDLCPLPDMTSESVNRINDWRIKGVEVYFVTNRLGIDPKTQTELWLEDLGFVCPTVIISGKKGEAAKVLGATHAIEDKAENAWMIHWLSPETKIYLLDYKYNRYDHSHIGANGVVRIYSLGEFLNFVEADFGNVGG